MHARAEELAAVEAVEGAVGLAEEDALEGPQLGRVVHLPAEEGGGGLHHAEHGAGDVDEGVDVGVAPLGPAPAAVLALDPAHEVHPDIRPVAVADDHRLAPAVHLDQRLDSVLQDGEEVVAPLCCCGVVFRMCGIWVCIRV